MMIKVLYIILISLFSLLIISCSKKDGSSSSSSTSTSGTIQWTQQFGTSSWEEGLGVTVDSSDNIYVTGKTAGGLDNNTNAGSNDIFLAKYNSSGIYQWTQQLGTSSSDTGYGVAVDSSDNIYVTGSTEGGLDNNTNAGSSDIFLAKYSSSGIYQWTQQLGTSSGDIGYGVAVDSSDNIYVTGSTSGGLDNNTNAGSSDIFLAKYSSSGIYQWTQQLGTSSTDSGAGVAVDSSDNIYVTGSTYGGLDNNTSAGSDDIFLVKYNSSGTKQWTKQLGATSFYVIPTDRATGIAIDSSNNVYVTGRTTGDMDGITKTGSYDFFLVKYNSSGSKQWTRQLGSVTITGYHKHHWDTKAYGVTVDSSNNIYVTGYTTGGLDGNTNAGSEDIFLVKYNSSGNKQWTRQLGTSSTDSGAGVTVDSSDNIYITGYTKGIMVKGGIFFGGYSDIFLVKYNF